MQELVDHEDNDDEHRLEACQGKKEIDGDVEKSNSIPLDLVRLKQFLRFGDDAKIFID